MSDQFLSPAPKGLEERILELFGGPSNAAEWMQNKDLEAMERRNEMRAELEAAGGGPLLDRPIPGANPEVPTVSDALLGALMSAAPMAGLIGRTAGGGNAPARAPGSRTPGDYVELFSGGGTGANWTTDPKRAASFARNPDDVLRVRVPRSVFEAGNKEAAKFGQPSRFDAVLPGEWANKATRTRVEPDVYTIEQPTGPTVSRGDYKAKKPTRAEERAAWKFGGTYSEGNRVITEQVNEITGKKRRFDAHTGKPVKGR